MNCHGLDPNEQGKAYSAIYVVHECGIKIFTAVISMASCLYFPCMGSYFLCCWCIVAPRHYKITPLGHVLFPAFSFSICTVFTLLCLPVSVIVFVLNLSGLS